MPEANSGGNQAEPQAKGDAVSREAFAKQFGDVTAKVEEINQQKDTVTAASTPETLTPASSSEQKTTVPPIFATTETPTASPASTTPEAGKTGDKEEATKTKKAEKVKKAKVENKIDLESNPDLKKWLEDETLRRGWLTDAQRYVVVRNWYLGKLGYRMKTNEVGGEDRYLYENTGKDRVKKEDRVKDAKNGKPIKFHLTWTPKLTDKGVINSQKEPSMLKFLEAKFNEGPEEEKVVPPPPQPEPETPAVSAETQKPAEEVVAAVPDIGEQLRKQGNLDFVKSELEKADKGEPNSTGIIAPELVNFLADNNVSDDEIRKMLPGERWAKARELVKTLSKPADVVATIVPQMIPEAEVPVGTQKPVEGITPEIIKDPTEQYNSYLESLKYKTEVGATSHDPSRLRNEKGEYVIDPKTNKPFEFKYYKDANEFLKSESERVNGKSAESNPVAS